MRAGAAPLVERNPQRRLSLTARNLEAEIVRRADDDTASGFGEMGKCIEARRRERERLAAKMGFDPVLFDDHAGGRLNEFELYELLERGS